MINFLIIWLVSLIVLMFIWASIGASIKSDDEAQRLHLKEIERKEKIKALYPQD